MEFDVSFSSDLTAVAFHDDRVDRVTTGSGEVAGLTVSQLGRLDLGPRHPLSPFTEPVRIPTVHQFVAECLRHNMKLFIDLKTWRQPEETMELMFSLYRHFPELKTSSVVTSFYPGLLWRLRRADPAILTSLSTRPHFLSSSSWEGTEASRRPRYTGLQQLAATCADSVQCCTVIVDVAEPRPKQAKNFAGM